MSALYALCVLAGHEVGTQVWSGSAALNWLLPASSKQLLRGTAEVVVVPVFSIREPYACACAVRRLVRTVESNDAATSSGRLSRRDLFGGEDACL